MQLEAGEADARAKEKDTRRARENAVARRLRGRDDEGLYGEQDELVAAAERVVGQLEAELSRLRASATNAAVSSVLVESGQRMSLQALTRALGGKRAAARKALVLEQTRVRNEEADHEHYGVAVEEHHARRAREFAKRVTAIRACEARRRDDEAAAASGAPADGAPADRAPADGAPADGAPSGGGWTGGKPDSFVTDGLRSENAAGGNDGGGGGSNALAGGRDGRAAVDAHLDGDVDEAANLYETAIDIEPMHRRNLCNCALFT